MEFKWRHDTRHNDTRLNDTQHNNTWHNNTKCNEPKGTAHFKNCQQLFEQEHIYSYLETSGGQSSNLY